MKSHSGFNARYSCEGVILPDDSHRRMLIKPIKGYTENMALIDCPDGTDFEFGILIQKKNIFILENGQLPNGSEVSKVLKKYKSVTF